MLKEKKRMWSMYLLLTLSTDPSDEASQKVYFLFLWMYGLCSDRQRVSSFKRWVIKIWGFTLIMSH